MIRIAVIAALVWGSWAAVPPDPDAHVAATIAVPADCSSDRDDRGDGTRWSAAQQAGASFTQSNWKFPELHAELAGAPAPGRPALPRPACAPGDSASRTPPHLLRIPLLI